MFSDASGSHKVNISESHEGDWSGFHGTEALLSSHEGHKIITGKTHNVWMRFSPKMIENMEIGIRVNLLPQKIVKSSTLGIIKRGEA